MTKGSSSAGAITQLSLLGDDIVVGVKSKRQTGWKLIDHCCAKCMGRLLYRWNGFVDEYRCCECGSTATGGHESACWCGVRVGDNSPSFECIVNKEKLPVLLNEIVVSERKVKSPFVVDKIKKPGRSKDADFF